MTQAAAASREALGSGPGEDPAPRSTRLAQHSPAPRAPRPFPPGPGRCPDRTPRSPPSLPVPGLPDSRAPRQGPRVRGTASSWLPFHLYVLTPVSQAREGTAPSISGGETEARCAGLRPGVPPPAPEAAARAEGAGPNKVLHSDCVECLGDPACGGGGVGTGPRALPAGSRVRAAAARGLQFPAHLRGQRRGRKCGSALRHLPPRRTCPAPPPSPPSPAVPPRWSPEAEATARGHGGEPGVGARGLGPLGEVAGPPGGQGRWGPARTGGWEWVPAEAGAPGSGGQEWEGLPSFPRFLGGREPGPCGESESPGWRLGLTSEEWEGPGSQILNKGEKGFEEGTPGSRGRRGLKGAHWV